MRLQVTAKFHDSSSLNFSNVEFSHGNYRSRRSAQSNEISIPSSSSVGKTSLITRFMYDSFDNTYQVSQQAIYIRRQALFVGESSTFTVIRCCEYLSKSWIPIPGDHRHRFPIKDYVSRRPHREASTVGEFSLVECWLSIYSWRAF